MIHLSRSLLVIGALLAIGLPAHAAFAASEDAPCDVAEVQYDVSANLKITNTTLGAGDGVHRVGPGKMLLRFDNRSGHARVNLMAYDMRQTFTVVSNVLFWSTRVRTNLQMRASRGPGSVADGTIDGHTLRWEGHANGVHSDGTLECDGSMCGKFGAPPSGTTEVHVGPTTMELEPFQFGADMKTFTMPFALISESDFPKERSLLAIAGRQVNRVCIAPEARLEATTQ
jgi:hypothetical protein